MALQPGILIPSVGTDILDPAENAEQVPGGDGHNSVLAPQAMVSPTAGHEYSGAMGDSPGSQSPLVGSFFESRSLGRAAEGLVADRRR